jgi:hypothetical protein
MNPLTLPGYTVIAASLLAQGTGTSPTALFMAVPTAAANGPAPDPPRPVIVGRWCFVTGTCLYSDPFEDRGTARSATTLPALAQAFEAFAARLAAEAAEFLARGTPLSAPPAGSFPLNHNQGRGIRAARRQSLEELGHAGWADTIVAAYIDPVAAWSALDRAGADHVEHEEELW